MKKIRTKPGKFFGFVMSIGRIFKKAPIIYNESGDETLDMGIFVSNHSAASGPLTLSLFFPKFFIPWGAHEMTESYINRWKYLYYVFYRQKIGYNKFVSFIIATGFAVISKMLYNGMQLIPTYTDARLKKTINLSIKHLDVGNSILLFPEDSNTGYHDKLLRYNSGFIYLSQRYYRQHKIDLPIYPIYYHKRLGAMIIGKKIYANELIKQGMSRDEAANYFKDATNDLGETLFKKCDQKWEN